MWGSPEARGLYIGQLDGSQALRLLDADSPAVYASSGHLLFVRQGTLYAQLFDPVGLALTGDLPIWSPDGTRIVFSSNRKGEFDLYEKPAAGRK